MDNDGAAAANIKIWWGGAGTHTCDTSQHIEESTSLAVLGIWRICPNRIHGHNEQTTKSKTRPCLVPLVLEIFHLIPFSTPPPLVWWGLTECEDRQRTFSEPRRRTYTHSHRDWRLKLANCKQIIYFAWTAMIIRMKVVVFGINPVDGHERQGKWVVVMCWWTKK